MALKDTRRIALPVSETTAYGQYNTTFFFTPEEWDAVTNAQLRARIDAEVAAWIYIQTHPEPAIEPSEDIIEQVVDQLAVKERELLWKHKKKSRLRARKQKLQDLIAQINLRIDQLQEE